MELLVKLVPYALMFFSAFIFMFAGSINATRREKKATVFSPDGIFSVLMTIVGLLPILLAFDYITSRAEGTPVHVGDPGKQVDLTVGRTYEVTWQSENGKQALIKRKDGTLLYVVFDAPVPKKFFVNDERAIVSLEK